MLVDDSVGEYSGLFAKAQVTPSIIKQTCPSSRQITKRGQRKVSQNVGGLDLWYSLVLTVHRSFV